MNLNVKIIFHIYIHILILKIIEFYQYLIIFYHIYQIQIVLNYILLEIPSYFQNIWFDTLSQILSLNFQEKIQTTIISIIYYTVKIYNVTIMKQSLWNEIVDCYKNYLKQDLTPTDLKIFLDSIQFIVRGIVNSSKLLYSIDSLENNEFE